ncbi:MAG: hypoxanthine phosphoribosyltransferase [Bdellovibrionaceae bacterium]|nr:hypoxanthine phosphoribosyltransferase [Pseudobdellovibrionaceae bacterium]
MKLNKEDMIPFLTPKEIDELVAKLARKIQDEYYGKELIMICPLKGSVHFLADLMRKLELKVIVDFVYLTSSGKGSVIKISKDISENIVNKHVLVVEEIIDSGRKLSFLKNRLLNANPATLKIACLLDKPARRELPIKPDFIGKTIDDRYVVGYGMDQEELGRNYSSIYHFKN